MGCIYRRKNKYWIKYYRHGKQYAESARSDKKAVAERLLKLREGEIAQGKLPSICFDRFTFNEIAEDFLTDYRINRKKTLSKAERCVNHLKKEFGGMRATEITTSKIKKYVAKRLSEGVVNATINRELAALKRMFNLAIRCTPSKVSQVPYIPMLNENNVRKGFIEHEDYLALREELPEYLEVVFTFAYFTGWRKGEILGLKWNQVDLQEGIVRLEPGETKNNEGRTISMAPELWQMMKELHRNRRIDCPYVFHVKGKQLLDFRYPWNKARSAIGKPDLLFHDLRRSAIRNMLRAGVPERVAMTISGHRTRSVFDRYNIISQDDLKEAARKLQIFNESQRKQLQFSYTRSCKEKNVVTVKAVNL